MPFSTYNELPDSINERLNAQEMLDVRREVQEQIIAFTTEQRKTFFLILEDIELQRSSVKDLLTMLQEKIPLNTDIAQKVAVKLWSEYFFMVQDYYGSCVELIAAHGGEAAASAEKAVTFLHPHRQMKKFIRSTLYEFSPEISEEYQCELIDQLIERAQQKVRKREIAEHFTIFFQSRNISGIDAGKIADAIELLVLSGAFSTQHAWYYLTLADTVIHARPFVEISDLEVPKIEEKKSNPEERMRELKNTFDQLPSDIKDIFLSKEAQQNIKAYSAQYPSFEMIFMRAAVKDIRLDDLALIIHKEYHLGPEKSSALRDEIIKTFFEPVMWYFTGGQKPGTEIAKQESAMADEKPMAKPEQPKQQQEKQQEKPGSRIESGLPAGQAGMTALESRHFDTYEELANLVIQKCITGMNEECRTRVQRALITRIRNIRTNIETAEKLIDAQHEGGCGITPEIAERAVKEAALLAQALQEKKIFVGLQMPIEKSEAPLEMQIEPEQQAPIQPSPPPESMAKPSLPLTEPTAKPIESLKEPPIHLPIIEEKPPVPKESPPPPPPPSKPAPVESPTAPAGLAIEEVDGIPTFVEKSATIQSAPQPPPSSVQPIQKHEKQLLKVEVRKASMPSTDGKKLTVSDVRKPPHLVGPIEELQTFSLKDFRRISANPIQAASKIFDKVQALEKESLPKKMEAIDAWKRSEVNQMYIEIGKESFGKGVPIAKAIELRKSVGKDFLTESEFDALLDLNTMLRQ